MRISYKEFERLKSQGIVFESLDKTRNLLLNGVIFEEAWSYFEDDNKKEI